MTRKFKPLVKKEPELNLIVPEHTRLASIQGGKKPPGHDWLSELPEGSQFVVKATKPINGQPPSSFIGQMGEVLKVMKVCRVIRMYQGEHSAEMIVIPAGFCETFELIEVPEDDDEPSTL